MEKGKFNWFHQGTEKHPECFGVEFPLLWHKVSGAQAINTLHSLPEHLLILLKTCLSADRYLVPSIIVG